MKMLGILLIAVSAVSAAAAYQGERYRHIERLCDFALFLSLMRSELQTNALPLPLLLETLLPRVNGSARSFAQALLQKLPQLAAEGFLSLWEESLAAVLPDAETEEKRVMEQLGQTLGRYDLNRQCQVLETCEQALRELAEEERRDLSQTGRLSWGLALSGAGMLVIVLL